MEGSPSCRWTYDDPSIYGPYEHHAEIEAFDIPTGYFNAQLEDDKRHLLKFLRHLAQLLVLADSTAKDFMLQDGTFLVEIVRASYGLPVSAKRWNSHFTNVLTSGGYVQCDSEPC